MADQIGLSQRFQDVKPKSIIGFALLPGIVPRLRGLSRTFSGFLFIFTQLFGTAGLIDRNHPCLRQENIGRYRFSEIVGMAASRVVFDKKHLPQTLMFFAIISGLVVSIATAATGLALLALNINVHPAHAQYFGTQAAGAYDPQQDWAFRFLQEVFGTNVGLSNLWGGAQSSAVPQHALLGSILGAMFKTYSLAMLIIATFMVLYLIITMVADAARTGQPFGSNFNSVWAPIRLALGIGLLIPIVGTDLSKGQYGGYNGAQLIVFQVAEWGSNLATNIWSAGLTAMMNNTGNNLIAMAQPTDGYRFQRGIFLVNECVSATNEMNSQGDTGDAKADIRRVTDSSALYENYQGYVSEADLNVNTNYCGEFKIPAKVTPKPLAALSGVTIGYLSQVIAQHYRQAYTDMTGIGLTDTTAPGSSPILTATDTIKTQFMCQKDKTFFEVAGANPADLGDLPAKLIGIWHRDMGYQCKAVNGQQVCSYLNDTNGKTDFVDAKTKDNTALMTILTAGQLHGWASAGSFMLNLVYANNMVSAAVNTAPEITTMPRTLGNKDALPGSVSSTGFWNGVLSFFGFGSKATQSQLNEATTEINGAVKGAADWYAQWPFGGKYDAGSFNVLGASQPYSSLNISKPAWENDMRISTDVEKYNGGGSTNPIEGAFQGLAASFMSADAQDLNPMARVATLGSSLFANGVNLIIAGGLLEIVLRGSLAIAMSVGVPLVLAGYLLAVVLPVALLMNFVFAVIEWVMSVFEAIVGMPLWALSFISVAGEGIGDKAFAGVMKMFEIMLRPVVITIVTVASFIIFSAGAHFFDSAFSMFYQTYIGSVEGTGRDMMDIGSIFIYALALYSIGNSCFKMIPTIANQFMGWIGGPNGFSGIMHADVDKVAGLAAVAGTFEAARGIGSGVGQLQNKSDAAQVRREEKLQKAREKNPDYQARQQKNNALISGGGGGSGGGGNSGGNSSQSYGSTQYNQDAKFVQRSKALGTQGTRENFDAVERMRDYRRNQSPEDRRADTAARRVDNASSSMRSNQAGSDSFIRSGNKQDPKFTGEQTAAQFRAKKAADRETARQGAKRTDQAQSEGRYQGGAGGHTHSGNTEGPTYTGGDGLSAEQMKAQNKANRDVHQAQAERTERMKTPEGRRYEADKSFINKNKDDAREGVRGQVRDAEARKAEYERSQNPSDLKADSGNAEKPENNES